MDFSTKCVQSFYGKNGIHSTPDINMSNIFNMGNPNYAHEDYIYRRWGHKNAEMLASALKDLYNVPQTTNVCITSSGVTAFLLCCLQYKNGERIIPLGGLEIDCMATLKRFCNVCYDEKYREGDVIFCTPLGNPFLEKYDIKEICNKAHRVNATVIVDNAMLSAYNYNPFDDGADVVIDSISKYSSGRGDVMLGAVIGLKEGRRSTINGFGLIAHPLDCYFAQSALPTLPLRMRRIQETAKKVAAFVKTISDEFYYDDRIGVITFCFKDGDRERYRKICNACRIFFDGITFGQNCSTIQASGYRGKFYIRLSIGLEDAEDLITDLKNAIAE